jgi:hypothetical protein
MTDSVAELGISISEEADLLHNPHPEAVQKAVQLEVGLCSKDQK